MWKTGRLLATLVVTTVGLGVSGCAIPGAGHLAAQGAATLASMTANLAAQGGVATIAAGGTSENASKQNILAKMKERRPEAFGCFSGINDSRFTRLYNNPGLNQELEALILKEGEATAVAMIIDKVATSPDYRAMRCTT